MPPGADAEIPCPGTLDCFSAECSLELREPIPRMWGRSASGFARRSDSPEIEVAGAAFACVKDHLPHERRRRLEPAPGVRVGHSVRVVTRPGEVEAERGGNGLTRCFREVQRRRMLRQQCPCHGTVIRLLLTTESPGGCTFLLQAEKDFDVIRIAADAKCQTAAWRRVDGSPMSGAQSVAQSRLVRREVENPGPARLYRSGRRRMGRLERRPCSRSS